MSDNMFHTILITGAKGQLGSALAELLDNGEFNVIASDYDTIDITNPKLVERAVRENNVDLVVNCAAYTQVDKAEEDEVKCEMLNALAVSNIAQSAKNNGAKVIHISTDYVFDGNHCTPYCENDAPNPKTVYGKTKLDGEKLLLKCMQDAIIIRTSWLYSATGNNFVKTMLRLASQKNSLNVVFDQVGTPTYAPDLANAICAIINSGNWIPGIYHFSNEGVISWYDFAKSIFRIAGKHCKVEPIRSHEFNAKAERPSYSVLDKSKIKSAYNISIPYWEESLVKCIKKLK